jgi:hypothetical protein
MVLIYNVGAFLKSARIYFISELYRISNKNVKKNFNNKIQIIDLN